MGPPVEQRLDGPDDRRIDTMATKTQDRIAEAAEIIAEATATPTKAIATRILDVPETTRFSYQIRGTTWGPKELYGTADIDKAIRLRTKDGYRVKRVLPGQKIVLEYLFAECHITVVR